MSESETFTILAVDDEEAVLRLLEHQLMELRCAFIPTQSPAEAMHILQTREIAVLICDLRMPDIDGNTVMKIAREANPNIVSIMLTATVDHEATIRAINEAGIWKFISKPWKREELLSVVREGITRYSTLARQQEELTELAREITKDAKHAPKRKGHRGLVRRTLQRIGFARSSLSRRAGLSSNRYKVIEILGEGGMGTVYLADDLLLGMPVAIKVLGSSFTRDKGAVSTLKQEARIAMQLSHRHIVRIHNLQKSGDHYFLVMEYVRGRTLRDILKRYGKLPVETVLQVVRVSADALSYAHRHKIIHRDLKPTNLMLGEDGVLKIIDFGVSCLVGTQKFTDDIIGTPTYMSPEQLKGKRLDHRTDIYSLGMIAYELLTGRQPTPDQTTASDVITVGPPDMNELPAAIGPVVEKAVAFKPEDRWPTADDFSRALMAAAHPRIS